MDHHHSCSDSPSHPAHQHTQALRATTEPCSGRRRRGTYRRPQSALAHEWAGWAVNRDARLSSGRTHAVRGSWRSGSDLVFSVAHSGRHLPDDSSREERGARKPSLLVRSLRKVPGTPSHPCSPCMCAGQQGCDGASSTDFQMSRKRPVTQLTCGNDRPPAADQRKWPFGCFTLVPLDEAESPRKVPEDSQGNQAFFPGHAGCAGRGGAQRLRASSRMVGAGTGDCR